MARSCTLSVILAVVLLTSTAASAQIKIHRHLRVEDGLVQSQVNVIHEDGGGFVWFGTFGGVSRWDGVTFKNLQTQDGLSSLDVRVIHELPDGTLLLGTSENGISVYRDGTFETINEDRGLPGNSVRAITRRDDDAIMVATSQGLIVFADATFDTTTAVVHLPGKSVSAIERRRAGGYYASTFGDGVFVLTDDGAEPIDPDGVLPAQVIRALHEMPDGSLFISVYKHGLWLMDSSGFHPFVHNARLEDHDVKAITPASDGAIYLSTLGGGVGVLRDGDLEMLTVENGLANRVSWNAHEGASGVVYLGTWSGVNMFRPGRLETINANVGLPANVVTSIAEAKDGTFYIGTIDGGVARYHDGVVRTFTVADGLCDNRVWSLCASRDGTIYVGTNAGVNALRDSNVSTIYREPKELHGRVYRIHESADGTLYFGTYQEVYRFRDGVLDKLYDEPLRGRSAIYAICETRAGDLYFGTGQGVERWRDATTDTPPFGEPLASVRVWSIHESRDGTLYFGTNGAGLCYIDGSSPDNDVEVIDVPRGLSDNTVYQIVEDSNGRLYATTHRGVNIVDRSTDPPTIRVLRHTDGLGSDECNQGAALVDSRGRVWFGTNGGASIYDPAFDAPDPIPPKTHITRVRLFERELPITRFSDATPFNHDENYFKFEFVGTYPPAPEHVKYRYRLSGIDRDWLEARERLVQYTALPHDDYTFEVCSSNDWGNWSEPATLAFTIGAPFWETWWFIALVIVVAGGAIWLMVSSRVRHLLAIERLRTKIAADLHDDIGAGLTSISITGEVMARKLPDDVRKTVKGDLDRIGNSARELVDSMSDIVWLVNPKRDSLHDLVARLGDVYSDTMRDAGISFRVDNADSLKSVRLQMERRQHIFLIFKEAMNNAVKYSECSRITLTVDADRRGLTMVLNDDGRGFDTTAPTSGNGLKNIETRARLIKARVSIESSPGIGTTVSLTL